MLKVKLVSVVIPGVQYLAGCGSFGPEIVEAPAEIMMVPYAKAKRLGWSFDQYRKERVLDWRKFAAKEVDEVPF